VRLLGVQHVNGVVTQLFRLSIETVAQDKRLSELFDDCGLDFAYHHLPIGCSGCCVDCSDPDELLVHELLDAHQLSTRVPPGRHFLDQMETERPTLGHDHRKEGDS